VLRANKIPAGLCYQRLTISDVPPFFLHGLNAVYLKNHGWYRIDARRNKEGTNAEFFPPKELISIRKGRMVRKEIDGTLLALSIATSEDSSHASREYHFDNLQGLAIKYLD
jgi:hypothetical protein